MANTTGLGDTIYAAVRKALEDSESGGGGGSSDFSMARVTVTSNEEITPAIFEFFHVCTIGEFQGLTFAAPQPMTQNLYIDVILYKGASLLNVMPGWDYTIVSTSGAIQQMDNIAYMISGDCTITVS